MSSPASFFSPSPDSDIRHLLQSNSVRLYQRHRAVSMRKGWGRSASEESHRLGEVAGFGRSHSQPAASGVPQRERESVQQGTRDTQTAAVAQSDRARTAVAR